MKKQNCPNCGATFDPDALKCGTCTYVAENRHDTWKPANMGKQRDKRIANRTGKKGRQGSFYERQN